MIRLRGRCRAARLGSIAIAVALIVGACAGASRASHVTTVTSTTTTAVAVVGLAPLTGLPVTEASVLERPAVIVKIDAAPQARPQSGLDRADVVIEERVEGGLARYMAIFQSAGADLVGPVRSVRSTDPAVVRPIGGLFAYSGGIPAFVSLLHSQGGVVDVGFDADSGAYHRRNDRPSPHNLYTSTVALRRRTPAGMGPPPALLSHLPAGQPFAGAGARPVNRVTVSMGPASKGEWLWDPATQTWQRFTDGTPQTVEGGPQLAFTTVVVQFVPYTTTPYRDPANAPVDKADVVGSGAAWIMASGQLVQGAWHKPSPGAVTSYTDAAGAPVAVPAGPVWITLAPLGASAAFS